MARYGRWMNESIESWFGNLKVLHKLMIGVVVAGVMMSLLALIGLSGIDRLKSDIDSVSVRPISALSQISMSGSNLALYQSVLPGLGRHTNKADFDDAVGKLGELKRQTFAPLDVYEAEVSKASVSGAEDGKRIAVLRQSLNDYFVAAEGAIGTLADGFNEALEDDERRAMKEVGLLAISGDVAAKQRKVTVQIHELMIKIRESAREANEKIREEADDYADSLLIGWACALFLGSGVGYLSVRHVSRNVGRMADVVGQAVAGNLQARARSQGYDEFGRLAKTLNVLLERAASFASAEEDRDRLQKRLKRFQTLMAEVVKGDLTKRGEVTGDVVGDVAQEFNLMIEKFSQLLLHVRESAERISKSADILRDYGGRMLGTAGHRSEGALKALETVEQVVISMRRVSEIARASSESAREAIEAAEKEKAGEGDRPQSFEGVHDFVRRVTVQIRTLDEHCSNIGRLASAIQETAGRTNLLALNAVIDAIGSGGAGDRFVVVSDQVQKLAQSSMRAARDVVDSAKAMQSETQKIVAAMEREMGLMATGRPPVAQTKDTSHHMSAFAQRSIGFAGTIAAAVAEQASSIDAVGRFVKDVIEEADAARLAMDRARAAVEDVDKSAESVTASIARFRLA
ncbi:MAG: methyl-accepting chemotaxis protein [Nitrospira sp.]|nr:methyl-accepting chemotaxis protein [Nitrospira sp.]MCP9462655.1 methyl-accepting chemotaxis protein [Nitrospira sp.]MCP9475751.1 methyl-accepting chemotaxis protein [Nitrospira sp.]